MKPYNTYEEKYCYGCGICEKKCPVNAISMKKNEEGFRYPVIEAKKCVDCGLCKQVCPIDMNDITGELGRCFAVVHNDKEVLLRSQSGGVFTVLSDVILEEGGSVYGAIIDDEFKVRHIKAEDKLTRNRMCGSKYVQSIIEEDIYIKIKQDLDSGRKVLFTGTPCQCAAIKKNYYKYKNLYIVDFICHGTPSPDIWRDYIKFKRTKIDNIEKVVFRNKEVSVKGFHSESIYDSNGKEYISNEYSSLFYSHLCHRKSCYHCQFAATKRYSDITMGDFWDVNYLHIDYSGRASMCFLNTDKGKRLFNDKIGEISVEEVGLHKFNNQPCLYNPIAEPDMRKKFWDDYHFYGIEYCIKKYATNNIKIKFKIQIPKGDDKMTEEQRKYKVFYENDIKNNRGLIVNQYDEVQNMMNYPKFTECFRKGYLESILKYATEKTEFYKQYSNFKVLQDFPVVNKQILKDNCDEMYVQSCRNLPDNKERRTHRTTGVPLTVYWNHKKYCRMMADMEYFAMQAGAISHEKVVCLIVNEKNEITSLEQQGRDNVYNIYCENFDDKSIETILEQLNKLEPKIVIGYGSIWKSIANFIYEGKADNYSWNCSSILSEAEALDERSREILQKYFLCPIYSRYGNAENGVLAQEDSSGLGYRFNSASYYLEILRLDSDEPVEDGEIGRVVITDLFNYAFPIIRYDNGDLAIKKVTENGEIYLSSVLGRKVDVLYTTDGKPVGWFAITGLVTRYRDIKQFQIIQEEKKDYLWVLNTKNHNYEELIINESKEVFGEDANIKIKYVEEIPILRSGKTQMTVCEL